jgi:hypothetical protein
MAQAQAKRQILPLRPLGAAEILDGAVRAVRANARTVLAIAVPFAIVRSGLVAVVQLGTVGSNDAAVLQFLGQLFVSAVFGTILTGLLAPVFSAELLGTQLPARVALARVGRGWFGLVVLALIVAVAQEAGVVVLIVGGVWLWGIWAVAAPALVLERNGLAALGRSFRLVAGSFWRTWGIRALRFVLTCVLGFFITLPFSLLAVYLTGTDLLNVSTKGISHPGVYVTILAIGQVLASIVTGPISAAVDVLLYTDLRMRKEGMDIVMGLPAAPLTGAAPDRPAVTAW